MSEATFRGRPSHKEHEIAVFPGKYLSIMSFRLDGRPVTTPVWFVQENGRLLVETDAGSFKVKRIRRNPRVRVAPCTAGGRLRGRPVTARAELLPESEVARVHRLMERKYRVDMILILPIWRLWTMVRGRSASGKPVIIAITPR